MESLPHPTKDILGISSSKLLGKTVCLCLTGSVGVINSPTIARELMRHGAEVITVMSPEACRLIHPNLMHWSTGNPVITELTGGIEHVFLAGERPSKKGKADIVVVCPATANTISKIATGIDDTPVTTICTTALGSKTPIVIVPAMHESMYNHPILHENISKLKSLGITFLGPRLEENKAKVASPEEVVKYVIEFLSNKKDLEGLNFLITSGSSREMIDRVRFISNPSSGKMGVAFAQEILARGGKCSVISGSWSAAPPTGATTIPATSTADFVSAMKNALANQKFDVLISAAALGDFMPEQKTEEKISSTTEELVVKLKPTPKLIREARSLDKNLFIVAFKAETDLEPAALVEKAFGRMKSADSNLVVANNVNDQNKGRGFASDTNEVFVIDQDKNVIHIDLASKRAVAEKILDIIIQKIRK